MRASESDTWLAKMGTWTQIYNVNVDKIENKLIEIVSDFLNANGDTLLGRKRILY